MSEPRAIDTLLAQYSASHLNHTNELIHMVCVPAIVFTLLGLLWSIHPLAAVAVSVAMLGLLWTLPPATVLPLSLAVFVLAWVGQFIGHKIEGKKPSFFDDLRFLLIGPLFVLGFLYRRLSLDY